MLLHVLTVITTS